VAGAEASEDLVDELDVDLDDGLEAGDEVDNAGAEDDDELDEAVEEGEGEGAEELDGGYLTYQYMDH
jgi:hypothetical protein